MKVKTFQQLLVSSQTNLRQTIITIYHGIALVVDVDQRLIGIVTDGDIRAWVIKRRNLDALNGALYLAESAQNFPQG